MYLDVVVDIPDCPAKLLSRKRRVHGMFFTKQAVHMARI